MVASGAYMPDVIAGVWGLSCSTFRVVPPRIGMVCHGPALGWLSLLLKLVLGSKTWLTGVPMGGDRLPVDGDHPVCAAVRSGAR